MSAASPTNSPRPVLIAGGGIGGMATALTLHQIGVPCMVFESVAQLQPLGVGINLQPNAVRELHDLGFGNDVLDTIGLQAREWALVGRNGSGKTRLLRLLAGLDEPANGHIERTGTQVYVAQQQDILPHTTLAELLGYEAIFAARARVDSGEYQPDDLETLDGFWDLAERLSEAFARARLPPFDPDKPTAELSGGERVRALLCGAFTAQADYLLLDEPTNHLDRQGRTWFYDQLARYQGGVLVASHDRELLAQVPRILELSGAGARGDGAQTYPRAHAERA